MLCSISSKISGHLPRTGISTIGNTQWCSYAGLAAIGSSSSIDIGKQRVGYACRLPNVHASTGKDGGVYCRNFSSIHHKDANLTYSVYQQHHSPHLTQVERCISTTNQTKASDEDDESKSNPSPHFNRIIFLETVAGVPGMVAAMSRHLRSLRRMQRDHGWIHTLLEEAENERMHLMTALEIKQPSMFFRLMVLMGQGIFVNLFFVSYLISPRFCHRFVGYLEEEAVITYTKLLKDLREDALPKWKDKIAPEISINYWKLRPDADYIDLFRAIRADEAHHREVNHTLSDIKPDAPNPYGPGK